MVDVGPSRNIDNWGLAQYQKEEGVLSDLDIY